MSNALCLARRLLVGFVFVAANADAQDPPATAVSGRASALPPAAPAGSASPLRPMMTTVSGSVQVVVRLSAPAMVDVVDEGAFAEKTVRSSRARQRTAQSEARAQQARVAGQAANLGAEILARLEKGLNALVMRVDAQQVSALRQLPDVVSVKPTREYFIEPNDEPPSGSLAQAAQYLQASGPRAQGYTGEGVTVAVFDSGIDFTHKNLGGPGTAAFYNSCHMGSGSPP
jgi:minor extracellular serine protease Vpr